MLKKNKVNALMGLGIFVLLGVGATHATFQKKRNLKVLPQDISDRKLDSIMESYNVALGVKCEYCHVKVKGFTDSLDYASDAEPMKEEARKMIRMVIDINKKNFWHNKNIHPAYLKTVTCMHCHRGEAYPPEY